MVGRPSVQAQNCASGYCQGRSETEAWKVLMLCEFHSWKIVVPWCLISSQPDAQIYSSTLFKGDPDSIFDC
jgi:hypothetical protein